MDGKKYVVEACLDNKDMWVYVTRRTNGRNVELVTFSDFQRAQVFSCKIDVPTRIVPLETISTW